MGFLRRIVVFRQGEAATAWLMFAYSFLAMTAYNIVKPITRSKFITDLGADNLPYVQLAAGVLIGLLMHFYGRGASKLPRRAVVPATQVGLAAVLLVFWLLFRTGAAWVSAAFFVFGLTLGLLLISQFWTLANDIYDSRQARRLFGFIGGGASLGGAMGAGITRVAVDNVGTDNLLPVSALALLGCTGIVVAVLRQRPDAGATGVIEAERGVGAGQALRMLAESRHLQIITLLIACAGAGAVIIEQQLNMAAEATGASMDEITRILADVAVYLSLAGFIVQVGVTSRLHGATGLIVALVLLPVTLGTTSVLILLTGSLWAPAAARVLDTSLRYTIDKTTREVLFLPLPAHLKHRAKAFVDVTMDRFARAAGAIALLVLIKPWGLGLTWPQLSFASLAIVGMWLVLSLAARREYLLAFRRSLGAHEMEPTAVRFDAADEETIQGLVEDLSRPDEAAVIYAIDMLETLGKRHLVPASLVQHPSPRVRARALGALQAGHTHDDSWLPVVRRMLNDPDPDVRAAAVRAVVAHRTHEGPALMRQYLDDVESRVSVTAAVELADSPNPADVHAAEAALTRLVTDTRPAAASARCDVASALARIRNPEFRTLLVPLLHDDSVEVAREAIDAARALGASEALFVPALVSRLGDRMLKGNARETLVSYGGGIVDVLVFVMEDPQEHLWVRRHVPATLGRIPTQGSMDALMAAIDDPDGFLRYKAIVAIETLRRSHPDLRFDKNAVEARITKETSRYYSHLSLRHNLVERDQEGGSSILVRALDDKMARALDRIFRLLGLLYAWTDIAAARYALEQGDPRSRAGALEYLDNLLSGDVRKRVIPILDTMPVAEKVRHANSVLKSRPRDVVDTVAQLIHDDDPVVGASAVQFVLERGLIASLRDDLEYVRTRATDRHVRDAAARVLDSSGVATAGAAGLPVVELANRLRTVPLFAFVSVDELFRVAEAARTVTAAPGEGLYEQGAPAGQVFFLFEGTVRVEGGDPAPALVSGPTALNFADAIEDRPLRHSFTVVDPVVGLAIDSAVFLTMLSDNIEMAQGLIRMLLASPRALDWAAVHRPPARTGPAPATDLDVEPIEVARLLRETPLFGHATVDQLKDLVLATREVRLGAGDVLWDDRREPSVYHVLAGEIRLETDGLPDVPVGPGSTIGVAETLTGWSPGRRAVAVCAVRALRLDQEDLFDVLADHGELLQGVFIGVINAGVRNGDRSHAWFAHSAGGSGR